MSDTNDGLENFFDMVGGDVPAHDDRSDEETSAGPTVIQTGPARAWAVSGNLYWGISESLDRIPPGVYRPGLSQERGPFLAEHKISTDALLHLPDSKSEAVLAEIEQFQTLRPAFTQRGFLFKRGILLWGPPGSGKTSTLHQVMHLVVQRAGGIALLLGHPGVATEVLQMVRRIEPDRQMIGILEDLDGLVEHHSVESYLALLDGEAQVDNVIYVATTNYPERLDRRFVDRPSRFDTVEYIGMPSAAARRAYLTHKDPAIPPADLERMVTLSEDLSIAHLREFIILTQCFGRSIEESGEKLQRSRHRQPRSDRPPDRPEVGFTKPEVESPVIVVTGSSAIRRVQTNKGAAWQTRPKGNR